MSEDQVKAANELYDELDKHIVSLMAEGVRPDDKQRVTAERLRNNLAACVTLGKSNPRATKMLLPNVLASVRDYLQSIKKEAF